jgi:mannose-6-phosphate isomerase-like protein (cupin superfamily)
MIIKQSGDKHFTKGFPCGATSDRVILPKDGVCVKVTHLFAPVGAEWLKISYPVDETVIIISGKAKVTMGETETIISAGACYAVSADEVYTLNVLEDAEIWCVFSPTRRWCLFAPGGYDVGLVDNS